MTSVLGYMHWEWSVKDGKVTSYGGRDATDKEKQQLMKDLSDKYKSTLR